MQTARKMAIKIHGRERGNRIWSMQTGTAHRKQPYDPEDGSKSEMLKSIHRGLSLYEEPVLVKMHTKKR